VLNVTNFTEKILSILESRFYSLW